MSVDSLYHSLQEQVENSILLKNRQFLWSNLIQGFVGLIHDRIEDAPLLLFVAFIEDVRYTYMID
jgi:hypothetical protein